MRERSDGNIRWLWGIALTSLALNLITITLIVAARGLIGGSLVRANQRLYDTLTTLEDYDYPLAVQLQDQVTLLESDAVLLDQTITVPISMSVPVRQEIPVRQQISVPININVPVRDTVRAPLRIQDTVVNVDVPIDLTIPINLVVPVEVDVSVPVDMAVVIREDLRVPVRELIPLQNGQYQPLSVGLDMQTTIPVPLGDLLTETQVLPMMLDLHRVLNIIESLLLLPAPDTAPPAVAPAPQGIASP